jgi:hypothetical protein
VKLKGVSSVWEGMATAPRLSVEEDEKARRWLGGGWELAE